MTLNFTLYFTLGHLRHPNAAPKMSHIARRVIHGVVNGGRPVANHADPEFDKVLQCGILAHGFLRRRCATCAHEKLVAFSCKGRAY